LEQAALVRHHIGPIVNRAGLEWLDDRQHARSPGVALFAARPALASGTNFAAFTAFAVFARCAVLSNDTGRTLFAAFALRTTFARSTIFADDTRLTPIAGRTSRTRFALVA
jgi:hypothetical protein